MDNRASLVTVASVAVTLGVALGLVASSASTSLHASTVVSRPVAVAPVGVLPPQSRMQSTVHAESGLQAQESQTSMESVTFQAQPTGVATWAIAAFVAAGAAMVAAFSAMQRRTYQALHSDPEAVIRQAGQAMGVAAVSTALAGSAAAASLTYDEIQSLSYLEVKGSGLANTCPIIAEGSGSKLALKSGNYKINNMCLEPSSFQVKVPSPDGKTVTDFEKTKLMTRLTYTLDGIRADLSVGGDGSWSIKEIDGIDYAATTVQLAGGERVPFLFTVKNLQAKGDAGQFIGQFDVPSYRGATFLDPKGRGGATGYDTAVALPAAGDSEELAKENTKSTAASVGTIAFKVAKVNAQTGEIAGVFESIQPSDTDLGAKVPKDIKTSGVWYGQISPA